MCRIGGRLRSRSVRICGVDLEIPPFAYLVPNLALSERQCLVGSLTGVVASKRVTEASKGTLSTVGNRTQSAMA